MCSRVRSVLFGPILRFTPHYKHTRAFVAEREAGGARGPPLFSAKFPLRVLYEPAEFIPS